MPKGGFLGVWFTLGIQLETPQQKIGKREKKQNGRARGISAPKPVPSLAFSLPLDFGSSLSGHGEKSSSHFHPAERAASLQAGLGLPGVQDLLSVPPCTPH